MLSHVVRTKRSDLLIHVKEEFQDKQIQRARELAGRRAIGEPLQYVTGVAEFCGLEIVVDPRVLIPRPETESLAETVSWRLLNSSLITPHSSLHVLDLGTGSGCIAIALAKQVP